MNDEKKGGNENQDEFEVEEVNSEIEEISNEDSSKATQVFPPDSKISASLSFLVEYPPPFIT